VGENRGVVAVLRERLPGDARPDEKDALVQAAEVSAALTGLGYEVVCVDVGLDLCELLDRLALLQPQAVFNLVESYGGQGALIATVPALLESRGYRVTGCDAHSLYLTSHKVLAKQLLCHNGLPTPDWASAGDLPAVDHGTWIVKSVWEHASLGLDDGCVVTGAEALRRRLASSAAQHGGEWFAERFVDGREFNVSVLDVDGRVRVLPVAEICFDGYARAKPRIVGYAAKWEPEAAEYHATRRVFPALPAGLARDIESLVRECWRVFGLSGCARVDFRLDAGGKPWILEVNANPCLARDAGLFAAVTQAGLSYEALIGAIVDASGLPR
jgi:D-alanine-D-alanine ligase